MPLIDCQVYLILTQPENCVTTSKATRDINPNGDPAVVGINAPTNATFEITDKRLCVPVVTLSTQDDNKLLKQLKIRFTRTIKRNRYRSEMSNQTKNKESKLFK